MVENLEEILNLNLEQVKRELERVETAFSDIKNQYSGFKGFFKKEIPELELDNLTKYFESTLKMIENQFLHEENRCIGYENSTLKKTEELNEEILSYISKFPILRLPAGSFPLIRIWTPFPEGLISV